MNLLLYSMVNKAWCIPSEGGCRSVMLLGIMYGLSCGSSLELVSDSNIEMSEFRTSSESVPCSGPNSFTWLELHRRGCCLSYRSGQNMTSGQHSPLTTTGYGTVLTVHYLPHPTFCCLHVHKESLAPPSSLPWLFTLHMIKVKCVSLGMRLGKSGNETRKVWE